MRHNATIAFFVALKRWRARAGFAGTRIADRLGAPVSVRKYFSGHVHGRYKSSTATYDLRPGTLDAWTVHPRHEMATHEEVLRLASGKGGVMLDVGGYCGGFSLRYRDVFDAIYIFEPYRRNFEAILRNVELSNASHKVKVLQAAVAATNGTMPLYLDQEDTHSLIAQGRKSYEMVNTISLDTYLQSVGADLCSVRVLKIDVEGAEIEVLRGATKLLSMARPLLVTEANSVEDEQSVISFMSAYGYLLHRRADSRNLIFLSA
jgi:FkbM family methyltransferase